MWLWLFFGLCSTTAEGGSLVVLGSPKFSKVRDVTRTMDGVVASVEFSRSLSIGNQTWNTERSGSVLVSLSSDGAVRWVKPTPMKVELTSSGEDVIYVAGRAPVSGDFLGCSVSTSGQYGSYVAQLDSSGRCQWLRLLESDALITVSDIASRGQHGVLVVGTADKDIRLGADRHRVTSPRAIYALRLSHSGESKGMNIGTTDKGEMFGAWVKGAAMSSKGQSAILGDFSGRMTWLGQTLESGAYVFKEGRVPKAASFVSVLSPKGDVTWSKVVSKRTLAQRIVISNDAGVYAIGNFDGELQRGDGFGPKFLLGQDTTLKESPTMWVAHWSRVGELSWARTLHSRDSGQSVGLALGEQELVLSGFAREQLVDKSQALTLGVDGTPDAFVARYALDGTTRSLKAIGGSGKDYASAMDGVDGKIVIGFKVQGTLTIDGQTVKTPSESVSNGVIWIP